MPPEMELDNLAMYASFVPQFTPVSVVFCQKIKDNNNGNIRMMKLMIIIDVNSSKCGRLKHFFPVFERLGAHFSSFMT